MKYIIFKQLNEEFPVLFPSTIQHFAMEQAVTRQVPATRAISAGFVRTDYANDCFKCYGDSMTLNLPSRTEDSAIVNTFLGF
jgi:hypothetical protein